jgi:peptide/histidine transporter 3/4
MPEAMRSIGATAYLSALGVGSFLCSAIISIVQAISSRGGEKWLGDNLNHAHLDYFYRVLARLGAFSLCVYVWNALRFVYKNVDWDKVSKGQVLQLGFNGYVDGEF